MIRPALLSLLLLTAPAAASDLHVTDGDSLRVGTEPIRLLDIDAPETGHRARCLGERMAGIVARNRMAELLTAEPVEIVRAMQCSRGVPRTCKPKKDRYGRTLARVYAAGRDVGAVLIAEGLAVPYRPGPAARAERKAHWCGGAR